MCVSLPSLREKAVRADRGGSCREPRLTHCDGAGIARGGLFSACGELLQIASGDPGAGWVRDPFPLKWWFFELIA